MWASEGLEKDPFLGQQNKRYNGIVSKQNCNVPRLYIDVHTEVLIYTTFIRWQCIQKKLLFGEDFGPAASVVCTFQ